MARYDLLNEMRTKQEIVKTYEHEACISYNKLTQSGDLAKEHYDYGVGFYDISMTVRAENPTKLDNTVWYCTTYFGTIDDGDFGSENMFDSYNEAINFLEKKVIPFFANIDRLPDLKTLNEMARPYQLYFTFL